MNYLNPIDWLKFFHKIRFLHFAAVGITGVAINLALTWTFVEFFFGREKYFYGYLIGLTANTIYNFTLHTIVTYKTKKNHSKRFLAFVTYTALYTVVQASLVKWLTPIIGIDYYIFVIAFIIACGSIVTFTLFKFWLFKERD